MVRSRLINANGRLLSLLAILFIALGPAFAPVLSLKSSHENYIEICTAYGLIKKAVAGSSLFDDTPDKESHQTAAHCLLCSLRSFVFLSPQGPLVLFPVLEAKPWAVFSYSFFAGGTFFTGFYSRAPPVFP